MFRDEILIVIRTDGDQKNPQKQVFCAVENRSEITSLPSTPEAVLGKHPPRLHGSRVLRAARRRGSNTRSSERRSLLRSVLRERVFLQDAPNPEVIAKTHLHIWWCRTDVSGPTAGCCSGL